MTAKQYVAAIDGGGTKTTCLIADTDGSICGRGGSGPANVNFSPPEHVRESIATAFRVARRQAFAAGEQQAAIIRVCAAAPAPEPLIKEALAPFVSVERIKVVHEATFALLGALGSSIGCVVLAGTGSFARARGPGGIECHAGGWGALLGDEGSAYDIGRRALMAIARAADRRGPATSLSEVVLGHWGLTDPYQLKPVVYSRDMTQARIAALAPLVAKAANAGDEVATVILSGAGRALAIAAATAIRGAGLDDGPVKVSTAGGVWRAGDSVRRPFVAELTRIVPEAVLTKPLFEPVIGGLLLAFSESGVPWTEALFERLCD